MGNLTARATACLYAVCISLYSGVHWSVELLEARSTGYNRLWWRLVGESNTQHILSPWHRLTCGRWRWQWWLDAR